MVISAINADMLPRFSAGKIHKLKLNQDSPFIKFWSDNFKRGHKNTFLFG
jgi:hypothetical protein